MTRYHWALYNHEESDDDDDIEKKEVPTVESDEQHNDLVYSDDDDDEEEDEDDDDDDEEDKEEDDENRYHQTLHAKVQPPLKSPFTKAAAAASLPLGIPSTTTRRKSSSRYVVNDDDDEDDDDDDDRNDMIQIHVQQYPPLQSYRNPKTASITTLRNLSVASRKSSSSSSSSSSSNIHPPTIPRLSSSQPSTPLMLSSPPQSNHDHSSSTTTSIIEYHHTTDLQEDMQRLTQLVQQIQMTTSKNDAIVQPSHNSSSALVVADRHNRQAPPPPPPPDRQQIRTEMEKIRQFFQTQQEQAQRALQQLIQQHERTADDIRRAMLTIEQRQQVGVEQRQVEEQQQQVEQQQQQQQQQLEQQDDENEEFEHRHRRHRESAEPDAIGSDTPSAASLSAPTIPLEHDDPQPDNQLGPTQISSLSSPSRVGTSASSKSASNTPSSTSSPSHPNATPTTPVDSSPAAAEPPEEYITRAIKLRAQLIDLERSVAEYDSATDPVIRQKRLQYKKLVNGKINTLAENVGKIQQVAADVMAAITNAKSEDQQYKTASSSHSATSSHKLLSIGKRYLVNLLSAKVIVRIQAEGFNGQRGDGFPLAHMLAIVAAQVKDIVPVLTAHIYTVCPTAIPTLPLTVSTDTTNPNNNSEDDFMTQLGMIRQKDGNFESFERFLSRTEGIVSLVANVMASEPSNHMLLGGHNGAIKWLKRFLSMLPPKPQSPLPLITAPVLDAFLTGAGHMMSLIHTELFKEYLDVITNDISTRLDESSIGMPSATRLRKTIKNGMEGFRTTLPSKALPALYYGANGGHSHASGTGMSSSTPSPFGTANASQVPTGPLFGSSNSTVASSANSSVSSAFGSSSNPFGSNTNATGGGTMASLSSPFESVNSNKNPFASGPTTSQHSPFGGGAVSTATSSSPFGATSNFSSFPSSDTAGNQQQQQSPFGSNFGSGSLTNSTPFGGSAPVVASPFGASSASSMPGFHAPAPTTLPFGQPVNSNLPFGGGNPLSSPTPFGSSQFAPTQTSGFFGGSNPNTGSTPFGSSSTPFGSSSIAPSPTPFSNNIQQQPFGGGQANPSSMSSFGVGLSSPPSSFGFGGGPSGGSGYGGMIPSHNNNNNSNGRNNADTRPPCKFFARGACRNGANCNFSHAITTSNANSDPYSSHQNTSFGGSSNHNNIPFGGPRR